MLLRQARSLALLDAAERKLLQGKKLALVTPRPGGDGEEEFIGAATELGAHVSLIRLGLDDDSSNHQIAVIARVLARLYDGVECQHLSAALVGRIAGSTAIPVFAGLATASHPTATLIDALSDELAPSARRRVILQAALLHCMR